MKVYMACILVTLLLALTLVEARSKRGHRLTKRSGEFLHGITPEKFVRNGIFFLEAARVGVTQLLMPPSASFERVGVVALNQSPLRCLVTCDLESDRRISYQDGVLLSKRFTCPFFETSAKDDIGVEDVFTELTRHVKRSRNTSRNTFSRDSRTRFSMRGLTISERKCKERLHALKKNERSTELRRTGSFRRFVCGAGALTQP
ncbi:predicted protein [Nematostella vectensis]|uniref:small monomeric GTPase n=1 Tax=Nematostella vectensis TaxID=45351 RepID=A7RSB1_NEMVE|nr:predicted protein [Nematostella vectensis]|eukprot:XP_001637664.1 predicted protein [Nematostella vectensis]